MFRRYSVKFFFLSFYFCGSWISRMLVSVLFFLIPAAIAVLISGGTYDVTWYQVFFPIIAVIGILIPLISLSSKKVSWDEMDDDQKYIFGSDYADRLTKAQVTEWNSLLGKYVR